MRKGSKGKYYGGGMPKGHKTRKTLDKEMAREVLRDMVKAELGAMTEAQIAHAKGIKYLVTRDKAGGKFVKVTEAMAGSLKGDEIIEVWEKDPSVQAYTDLVNRTLDKPTETLQATVTVAGIESRIKAARKRASGDS